MSCYHQKMKDMKNIVKFICAALVMLPFAGCNPYETWPLGLPEYEHVYYFSNVKTGNGTELDLQHEIASDGKARFLLRNHKNPNNPDHTPIPATEWVISDELNVTMPMDLRFISENIRSYDVVTYLWVETRSGGLTAGTDYQMLSANGTPMTPNAQGAYSLTWPKAEKAQQSVKIKRLSDAAGELRVMTMERARLTFPDGTPENPDRNDAQGMINNQTSDYTVRGLWHDYRFPVIVRFLSTNSDGWL